MKGIRFGAVVVALLVGSSAFAMQGRGRGGGAPGGIGGSSNSGRGGSRGNAPASLPSNPGARSTNRGNSSSAGKSEEHKPDSAGPKDAMGFKNYGQYMAARHASDEIGIPLEDLKTAMVDDGLSLGDAIHKYRPNMSSKDVDAATKKAEDAGKKADEEKKKGNKPAE
ncbi:MAG TPA: hypothetical protein VFY29_13260 [Terriglobia bacterium]|nr:hypothetical protein [Terriglobia bacterium]